MKNILTAEEYCNEYLGFEQYPTDTPYFMKEFAKLHVEAALKAAAKSAIVHIPDYGVEEVDEDSILTSYPLTNIK